MFDDVTSICPRVSMPLSPPCPYASLCFLLNNKGRNGVESLPPPNCARGSSMRLFGRFGCPLELTPQRPLELAPQRLLQLGGHRAVVEKRPAVLGRAPHLSASRAAPHRTSAPARSRPQRKSSRPSTPSMDCGTSKIRLEGPSCSRSCSPATFGALQLLPGHALHFLPRQWTTAARTPGCAAAAAADPAAAAADPAEGASAAPPPPPTPPSDSPPP